MSAWDDRPVRGQYFSCGGVFLQFTTRIRRFGNRRLWGRSALGQSLVEFALVTPILLLVFAGAADFGRAFYAYVAIENAAKEGALYGARAPLCDDTSPGSCTDPNNVVWRVQNELKDQGIRNPDGTQLVPTAYLHPGQPARSHPVCRLAKLQGGRPLPGPGRLPVQAPDADPRLASRAT